MEKGERQVRMCAEGAFVETPLWGGCTGCPAGRTTVRLSLARQGEGKWAQQRGWLLIPDQKGWHQPERKGRLSRDEHLHRLSPAPAGSSASALR